MTTLPQDRLVEKSVALGTIRELEEPQDFIGTRLIAPWMEVESDDVIFDYALGLTAGLAPARAEDAESEMAGKDETFGSGRASLIDWAIKDHWNISDVSRYRESLYLRDNVSSGSFPLTITRMVEGFDTKVARALVRRRRMLDNRIEWLIMTALWSGHIAYNDGKIAFDVDYQRPGDQQDMTPSAGLWDLNTSDPIVDIENIQQDAHDTYGVNIDRALISKYTFRKLARNTKFQTLLTGTNPMYTVAGWSDERAKAFIAEQTGLEFILYDSVFRTRALGSQTVVNTRYTPANRVIFLPSQSDIDAIDDAIGFAKTLTSPHVEGNWSAGFYEWERETVDPWSHDQGNGVKAFPVFPHMDKTYVMTVLA